MQIPINKEIRHYQEEIFLGLNLRQMICSGAAIAVAVAVYLGLTPLLGHETAGWICIVAAAPIAAAGFFTYDCLTFEKFLLVVIDSTIIRNDWRLWKTENKYCKKKKGDQQTRRRLTLDLKPGSGSSNLQTSAKIQRIKICTRPLRRLRPRR